MRLKEYLIEENYDVPKIKSGPAFVTSVPPEKRTLKNLPRYKGTDKPVVQFKDWLGIDGKKRTSTSTVHSWGWGYNDKCWGWSHRAITSYAIGDIIKIGYEGNWKNKEWTIKTREDAEKMAISFAKEVA